MNSVSKKSDGPLESAEPKANPTTNSQTKKASKWDLSTPDLYLNRELTWLNFNLRVLHEAEDERTPPLERLKFIAIVCSNLDEFFMKRIGGLKQQLGAGLSELTIDGHSPEEQIKDCHEFIRNIEQYKSQLFDRLSKQLTQHGIAIAEYSKLTSAERDYLKKEYYQNFFPLVTPQGIDPAHPFPFISNLALNLLVTLREQGREAALLARVKVPAGQDVPRFLRIPGSYRFVALEDVMSHNLEMLFPGMDVVSCEMFRVTRNAVAELDEDEVGDLLAMIETELRYRKFAPVVRLQVEPSMSILHRGMLAAELGLDEEADVFEVHGIMGKSSLMELLSLPFPALKDPPHYPIDHPRLKSKTPIFYNLREQGPMLLFHPYESFSSSVERFLKEASEDPKVRAIKMTLYRTARQSKVIQALVNAARNGKQVAVIVELKARFDEAANIQWANHLEEAGIHVTYGIIGFKTHSKVILVVRRDYDGLRRYAHISTGNYHEDTARLYTDFGLLTSDQSICEDLTEFFNYLSTGYSPKRNYKKIIIAPTGLKAQLVRKIKREIQHHQRHGNGYICFKMNALEDPNITKALYQAGAAGVSVDLIIRDTCRLRPSLPGLSESIRVISIVGRFLEHARVYYFRNNEEQEFFLGSADCMKRNLEARIEVIVPVEDPMLCKDLMKILKVQISDHRNGWDMQADGSYIQRQPQAHTDKGCQQTFIQIAEKRRRESAKIKQLSSKGKSREEHWSQY